MQLQPLQPQLDGTPEQLPLIILLSEGMLIQLVLVQMPLDMERVLVQHQILQLRLVLVLVQQGITLVHLDIRPKQSLLGHWQLVFVLAQPMILE